MESKVVKSAVTKNTSTGKEYVEVYFENDGRRVSFWDLAIKEKVGQTVNVEITQNGKFWNGKYLKDEIPTRDISKEVSQRDKIEDLLELILMELKTLNGKIVTIQKTDFEAF